ncbi:uncharacterized protein [Struthio camelus]|uniref:uncharacterized protein n=1 Tax=Struthio camelus TaxID=8801 RepID=UPI003603ED44
MTTGSSFPLLPTAARTRQDSRSNSTTRNRGERRRTALFPQCSGPQLLHRTASCPCWEIMSPQQKITFLSGFEEDDPGVLNHTAIIIVANTLTLIAAVVVFTCCVWLACRLKTGKEKSPENDVEASALQTLGHCQQLPTSLQRACSRCASPSTASIELCSTWDDDEDCPYGGLFLLSPPPTPDSDDFSRSASLDSATERDEHNTSAGAPGSDGPEPPTSDEA